MTPVSPERWREIQRVFHAAADCPPAERAAALDALCGGDAALRGEVERLLVEDDDAAADDGLLAGGGGAAALGALAEELLGADPAAMAGRRLGPYTVRRLIGRGGMGAVYLAERADVGLTVALKVVAGGGLAAPEQVGRFLLERRVLARLEHPNIARLLDAGVAEDGTPWLAMEYVRGEPVDRYCDARRLPVTERLALMERVCAAVAYAHRHLVVHRDLKPANVLVGEDGAPKLLDFGIAKLLQGGEDDDENAGGGHTAPGARLLTPGYAAPEQLAGAPVTVAADVYALGVVLYELLTGRRPHAGTGRRAADVERAMLHTDPLRPSVAVTRPGERRGADGHVETVAPERAAEARATAPAQLGRDLAGDLDAIVMRALAREPARRYASVEALLDDLRQHRLGRPVRAQPDTGAYRARKFIRRNRPAVVGAASFVVLLAGFAGAMVVEQARTARERDRAEAALALARREAGTSAAVTTFLAGLFTAANPYEAGGDTVTVREVLERGAARVDQLRDQPDVQARMLDVIGRVYQGLGQDDRALVLHRRALGSWRARYAPPNADMAATLHEIGKALTNLGPVDSAAAAFESALAMRRQLSAATGEGHEDVAKSLVGLGSVLLNRGDYAGAERRYREALAVYRSARVADSTAVGRVLNNLAVLTYGRGRYAEAETVFRELLATRRAQLGPRHPLVGETLGNLGLALHDGRKYADAESSLRQAVAIGRAAAPNGSPAVALALNALGRVLTAQGRLAEADTALGEALAMRRASSGPRNPTVGATLLPLGSLRARQGDGRAADSLYGEALALFRAGLPPTHVRIAEALSARAALYLAEGRLTEAAPAAREAYTIFRQQLGPDHPKVAAAGDLLVRADPTRPPSQQAASRQR